jgi:hypothetical protein
MPRKLQFCAIVVGVLGAPLASARASVGVWTTAEELSRVPASGLAWESLVDHAAEPAGRPVIAANDDDTDTLVLAKALVYARIGGESLREEVIASCMAAIGSEQTGETLALGRNIVGYVIAADLVGLPPAEDEVFRAWLVSLLDMELDDRTLRSTHEERPNNWGTAAGAARAAIAVYLGDEAELAATAAVFKGWLGDRDSYDGFDYGHLWWQSDPQAPVGINPPGAQIDGHSVDGVLPDDQRRGGPFMWPPPHENYVYTALQGAVVQAAILARHGYDAWNWQDQALLRAFRWLHKEAGYPAEGDDTWQPHLVNAAYGACFPAPVPSSPGKNMGWTDWTHGGQECAADLDGDGSVESGDLFLLLLNWGSATPCPGDQDGSGEVNAADMLNLLSSWGACP